MKYLEQKPDLFWWTKNTQCFLYFVREINGILLGFFALAWIIFLIAVSFIWKYALNSNALFIGTANFMVPFLTWTTLISSIIHTLTWLSAMPKILPLPLSAIGQKIAYAILVVFWIGLSYLLLNLFYLPSAAIS
jgi:fumarate reductase subunit C